VLAVSITGVNTKGDNPGTTLDFIRFSTNHSVAGATSDTYWSEIIVADEDTRKWTGLYTLAPNGAGTTNQWSGALHGRRRDHALGR
jgi:hypothetical protein